MGLKDPDGYWLRRTGTIGAVSHRHQQIVDKSNLKPGLYDISLHWAPNGPPADAALADSPANRLALDDPEALPIFSAVQEQLGLRLVSRKGPVEVLIIDAVQKPSAN